MKVLAIDPGVTTGWAIGYVRKGWNRLSPDIAMAIEAGVVGIEWGEARLLKPNESAYDLDRSDLYARERRVGLQLIAMIVGGYVVDEEMSWEDADWAVGRGGFGAKPSPRDLSAEVDVVVMEDFTVYPGLAREVAAGGAVPLAPVRIAGMVSVGVEMANAAARKDRAIGHREGHVVELKYVMASMAKTTVTNERLKRWGLWAKGSEHSRDAIRHLVTYLR